MRCNSRVSHYRAIVLIALFSLALASCGGGGGGGENTTSTSYTVTANAGAGGSISPETATVDSGSTTSFTVAPDSGYSVNTVTGCGGTLVDATFTTGAITADCTVTASFVSDGLPTLSITDANVAEGDSGTSDLVFTVTLSALSDSDVSVDFATSDNSPAEGSATADSDYTAIGNTTLVIPAGDTSGTITVSVTGDTTVESDETLTLTLSNPTGATLGAAVATGTINNDDSAPPALPTVSITNSSIIEGRSGTTNLSFTVTLSAASESDVDVDFATSDNSPAEGSATAGSDYTAGSGTVTIPAASTSAVIRVSVLGDANVESDETFTVTLASTTANAVLGASKTATGIIFNDDADGSVRGLNDTGTTTCSDNANNDLTCPQASHPGQDAEYGRDAQMAAGTLFKFGAGRVGFDFIKLDSNGAPLADQAAAYAATPWNCVQDNVTNLTWEVKSTDGGLHDAGHTYSWFNSTGISDGGDPGTANGGTCVDTANCDTEKYVAAVNAAGLCGQTDWRLPTVGELASLIDSSIAFPGPTIDTGYFPNTGPGLLAYWSSLPYATLSDRVWFVYFGYGGVVVDDRFDSKSDALSVRLVRGGQ